MQEKARVSGRENGLIIEIGEWVLREACLEAASWPRPLQVAVNLSPVQFQAGDLERSIHQILLETGLAPTRLEVEITEGVLIGDFTRALNLLRRSKALGIRIAMDDFRVETEAQRAFLEHEACEEMQGYLIGRPEPIEQYCDLIGINVERRRYA